MGRQEWEPEFDRFFREMSPQLIGQAFALSGDLAGAQDLAQEALARAWAQWSRVRDLDNKEAWVRHVLHNLAISDWRKRRTRRAHRPVVEDTPAPDVDAMSLADALRSLPALQGRAIVLHDGVGLPVPAVAAELGVPEGTVRSWLSRGRSRLAEQLRLGDEENTEVVHDERP